jgi:hypothetical protein
VVEILAFEEDFTFAMAPQRKSEELLPAWSAFVRFLTRDHR